MDQEQLTKERDELLLRLAEVENKLKMCQGEAMRVSYAAGARHARLTIKFEELLQAHANARDALQLIGGMVCTTTLGDKCDCVICIAKKVLIKLEKMPSELSEPESLPMVLYCWYCGRQHIDKPDPSKGWDNPPHKSHLCHGCGAVFRPAGIPTVGVEFIQSRGNRDYNPPVEAGQTRMVPESLIRSFREVLVWWKALKEKRLGDLPLFPHPEAYVLQDDRIYRLGLICYEWLAGKPYEQPFDVNNMD